MGNWSWERNAIEFTWSVGPIIDDLHLRISVKILRGPSLVGPTYMHIIRPSKCFFFFYILTHLHTGPTKPNPTRIWPTQSDLKYPTLSVVGEFGGPRGPYWKSKLLKLNSPQRVLELFLFFYLLSLDSDGTKHVKLCTHLRIDPWVPLWGGGSLSTWPSCVSCIPISHLNKSCT